jgi:hypothetical protein
MKWEEIGDKDPFNPIKLLKSRLNDEGSKIFHLDSIRPIIDSLIYQLFMTDMDVFHIDIEYLSNLKFKLVNEVNVVDTSITFWNNKTKKWEKRIKNDNA